MRPEFVEIGKATVGILSDAVIALFDATTGLAKTGDAANITCYVSKDHGTPTALTDTSATEMSSSNAPGVYVFDLTQAETNADELTFTAKSTTSNITFSPRFISTFCFLAVSSRSLLVIP